MASAANKKEDQISQTILEQIKLFQKISQIEVTPPTQQKHHLFKFTLLCKGGRDWQLCANLKYLGALQILQ